MFEQPEPTSSSKPLAVLAGSAVGCLLALGFCGLDAHFYPNAEFGGSSLAVIGLILGLISVLVFLGAAATLVGQAIARFFRR